ncbi:MAG: hypothetical protein Q7U02_05620 [Desulfosalsimonadaceae bacterium]|nr:hypothetical protein [Desulfosalsimonadaceae bacterium]
MTETLIVTSSIHPVAEARGVRIIEPSARLFQLCCSLISWADVSEIKNVVLGDNTKPEYDFQPIRKLMESKGKKLEIFTFDGDRKKVAERGKGYGEGEILKHVFERSSLIRQSNSFYKVTGRIFVGNFSRLHQKQKKNQRVFDNPLPWHRRYAKKWAVRLSVDSRHGRGMVRTVFYKCDTGFFSDKLLMRYEQVNDHAHFYLEHAYFYPLIKYGFSTFKMKPSLVGFSSSSGHLYQEGNDYPEDVKDRATQLASEMDIFA